MSTTSSSSSSSSSSAAALVGNSKDLVGEILSKLPLNSVMRCGLVCKEWCSLTSTQSFIEMHENNQFSIDNNNNSCVVVQYYDQSTSASDHFNTLFGNFDNDYKHNNTDITMIREYMHLSNIFSQVGEDGNGKMYSTAISNSFFHKIKTYYHINLISSCRGFLLFTAKPAAKKPVSCMTRMFGCPQPMEEEYPALILYNPVTKEQFTVISKYVYCGFYYHLPTKEHRILYRVIDEAAAAAGSCGIVTFLVIELENNYFMRFLNVDCPNISSSTSYYQLLPDPSTPPVISNGSLHWIVSEDDLHGRTHHHPSFPDCSCTILSFGMESEDFHWMPHPTLSHSCSGTGSNGHRHKMNLLEMEGGVLCLCDDHATYDRFSKAILEIYVMEDYEKWTWVRRYFIYLNGCIDLFYWERRLHTKALKILQGDKLLLQVDHPPDSNLNVEFLLYNLNDPLQPLKRSKKKKKKKKKKKRQTSIGNLVVFTPSLASIYQRNGSSATDIKFLLVENGFVVC